MTRFRRRRQRWEMTTTGRYTSQQLCERGWEPFAVDGVIYFKRRVKRGR